MSRATYAARSRIVLLGSAAALTAGGLALVGWALGIDVLKSIVPGTVPMKLSTAVAFVLLGIAFVAAGGSARAARIADLLAVGVAVLAATVLLQYPTNADFGIDHLFVREAAGATGTVHPGRMSPQTAISFILLGGGLLAARRRRFAAVVLACSVVPAILGGLNLLDALLGATTPTFLAAYTQMAIPTAAAFMALGIALADLGDASPLMRAIRGGGESAGLALRLLAAILVIPVILAWLRLAGERAGLYDTAFGVSIATLAMIVLFVVVISRTTVALHRSEEQRSLLERARAAGEARLQGIIDFAPSMVYVTDRDGRFQLVNRGFAQFVGRDPAQIVGLLPSEVMAPAVAAPFAEEHRQALRTGTSVETERALDPGVGSVVHALVHYPLRDLDGRTYAIGGMASDVTRRKQAEAEADGARRVAVEAQQAAEAANQAKTEFLSRMSHELRTPLNSVLGFAQLLELGDLDESQRDHVGYIRKAGRQLLDLINEVLDISQVESGNLAVSAEPVWVPEVIAEQLAIIEPLARERDVSIEPWDAEAASWFVLADRQRLRQVLLNLLSNAVKYNRPGGHVAIGCRSVGDRVLIEVADTGYGIAADKLDRLFVPFDRLGAERSAVEGTGIGLALARRLVERMGGVLHVESKAGEGSTFTVELSGERNPAAALVEAPAAPSAAAGEGSLREHMTVLCIEDNPVNVRLLQEVINRRTGIGLLTAVEAGRGLVLARERRPDLILLDLHLPDMPGDEALRRLKSDARTSHIPVAVLSADATHGQRERLRAAGAVAYLTKPLDVAELLALLDETADQLTTAADQLTGTAT